MPIVEILTGTTPGGLLPFDLKETTAMIKEGLVVISELQLIGLHQIDVYVPFVSTESETIIVKVLLDEKPERTKKVLDKVAHNIKTVIERNTGDKRYIEVLVSSFNHTTSGFACTKW